jgi:hypothetical protein
MDGDQVWQEGYRGGEFERAGDAEKKEDSEEPRLVRVTADTQRQEQEGAQRLYRHTQTEHASAIIAVGNMASDQG